MIDRGFYMETWHIRFFTIHDGDVGSKWPQILGLWLSLVFCGETAEPCSIEVGQLDRPHIVFVDFSVLVMLQGWKDPTWSNGWAETDLEEKALLGKQMQLQYVAVMPLDTDPLLLQGQRTSTSLACFVSPGAVWIPALAEGCGAKVSCRGAKKRADDIRSFPFQKNSSDVPWNSPETGFGNVAFALPLCAFFVRFLGCRSARGQNPQLRFSGRSILWICGEDISKHYYTSILLLLILWLSILLLIIFNYY